MSIKALEHYAIWNSPISCEIHDGATATITTDAAAAAVGIFPLSPRLASSSLISWPFHRLLQLPRFLFYTQFFIGSIVYPFLLSLFSIPICILLRARVSSFYSGCVRFSMGIFLHHPSESGQFFVLFSSVCWTHTHTSIILMYVCRVFKWEKHRVQGIQTEERKQRKERERES